MESGRGWTRGNLGLPEASFPGSYFHTVQYIRGATTTLSAGMHKGTQEISIQSVECSQQSEV